MILDASPSDSFSRPGFTRAWHPARWGINLARIALLSLLLHPLVSGAHAPQENYIWLNVEADHIYGRFEVNIKDVKNKLGIDVDAAGATRLEGVRATQQQVQDYLVQHFSIADREQPIALEFLESNVFEDTDFLQYPFTTARLPADNLLNITNTVFLTPDLMRDDRLHRSLIVVEYNKAANKEFGGENVALVFGPGKPVQEIDLANPQNILQWKDFLWQGVLHISAGLDHVLFIVLLLLTTVLKPVAGTWQPQPGFVSSLWKTLKIVTVFTIAHSITLTLAALDLVSVNPVLVETVIALSIVALAVHNLNPRFGRHTWLMIFIFGLFHGLGFASVMGDLQFRTLLIERILVMFNIGVELGQMAIVFLIFPILYVLRTQARYPAMVVTPVSVVAALVAVFWVFQRSGMLSV